MALTVVVAALTWMPTSMARAGESGCVDVVASGDDAYEVTLRGGCDLRSIARALPQRDATSGGVLPMQDQLRSIYAYNEQTSKSSGAMQTVRRGCVRTNGAPPDATAEEKEFCPKGLVNYYGIASGLNRAIIRVPKTRALTRAEKLETLGRTTCATLLGVKSAYGDDAAVPAPVRDTLDACSAQLGKVAPVALDRVPEIAKAVAAAPAVPSEDTAVFDRRIRELEQGRAALLAAAEKQQERANMWITLLSAALVMLLAMNVMLWLRGRKAAQTATAGGQSAKPEEIAQVVAQLKKEFKTKLAAASQSHGTQLREQIASMHAVEQEYEEAIEHIRTAMQDRVSERDRVIAELEKTNEGLAHQVEQARMRVAKSEKQVEKLRTRLRSAKNSEPPTSEREGSGDGVFQPAT